MYWHETTWYETQSWRVWVVWGWHPGRATSLLGLDLPTVWDAGSALVVIAGEGRERLQVSIAFFFLVFQFSPLNKGLKGTSSQIEGGISETVCQAVQNYWRTWKSIAYNTVVEHHHHPLNRSNHSVEWSTLNRTAKKWRDKENQTQDSLQNSEKRMSPRTERKHVHTNIHRQEQTRAHTTHAHTHTHTTAIIYNYLYARQYQVWSHHIDDCTIIAPTFNASNYCQLIQQNRSKH